MVPPALPSDTTELEAELSTWLPGTVTGIKQLHDGLNLLLEIRTDAGKSVVLRRPNKLRDADYMNALDSEYRVLELLSETPVPAPEPLLYCEDESLLDAPFYLMTRIKGEPVPLGSSLPARFQTPNARHQIAAGMIDELVTIHSVDPAPFASVVSEESPREQVARDSQRLDEATTVTGHEVPTLRSVGDWLLDNAPADSELQLLHGDFRPGNLLFAGTANPTIAGVLDWETALLGDPRTELGYLLFQWRDEGDPTPPLDGIEARHQETDAVDELRRRNEHGISPFTAAPGSPTRRELVERYEQQTGRQFDHERFFRAHAAFALATVWEDLHRIAIEAGNDSEWEPHIEYVALVAEQIAEGTHPL